MPYMNKVFVMGHLGQDPEVRYSSSGAAFCTLSVASTRKWKDKDGELQEETEWHRISAFGRRAEVIGEYLKKGSLIMVEGYLRTREYEKGGVKRYSTEIMCEDFKMFGGDKGEQRPASSRPAQQSRPASSSKPKADDGFSDMDDDLPPF